MTCGVCHPEAFQGDERSRIFGYAVSNHPGALSRQIRQLHHMGAQYVYVDAPKGIVSQRPGYLGVCRVMRDGDKLVLANDKCLGTKPQHADRHLAALERSGLSVHVLTPEQP